MNGAQSGLLELLGHLPPFLHGAKLFLCEILWKLGAGITLCYGLHRIRLPVGNA